MGVGPLFGRLCGRWPLRRSALVFGILAATATVWTVVLLWPGRAPLPLLVVLVVVLGHERPRLDDRVRLRPHLESRPSGWAAPAGSSTWAASWPRLLTILAVGVVLDLLTPGSSTAYDLDAFRAAFAVQYVFWAIGLVGVLRHRRQLRARLARDGVVLAPLRVAVGARMRGGSAYR